MSELDLSFAVVDKNNEIEPTESRLDLSFVGSEHGEQKPRAEVDYSSVADEQSMLDAALISAGRGFYTVGRGIGLVEPEDEGEAAAYGALKKKYPKTTFAGEIVGEAAPFAVAGGPLAAITKTGARIAGAGALGALEGGVLANAQTDRPEQIAASAGIGSTAAAVAEYAIPYVGRIIGKAYRKLKGRPPPSDLLENGRPTQELQEFMDEAGLSIDDLNGAAIEYLKAQPEGLAKGQVLRAADFESLNAPYTTGDITQDFSQKAAEARLVESSADVLGDPLREVRLAQDAAFRGHLDKSIKEAGIPDAFAESLKDALSGRKKSLSSEKNSLYRQAMEQASEIGPIPIIPDNIIAAIPDGKTIRRISRIKGNQADAVNDLMVEFGLNRSPESVESFLKSGGEIEPLSIQNFEDFRAALNQIERADQTGASSVLVGPIKRALDEEADLIDQALKGAGADSSVLDLTKQARGTVRQIKTEFSPQSIVGRLIDVKKDGVTPVIEGSKVYKTLMAPQAPPEHLMKTMESLRAAGPKGKTAINNLQASTVLDLMNVAYKAQTRRISGNKVFGAVAYNNRLDQIGQDRLKAIFKDKPEVLNKLKTIGRASQNATASSAEMPKGSATTILDSMKRLGFLGIMAKIPGAGLPLEGVRMVVNSRGNRKVLEKSLKSKPRVEKVVNEFSRDFGNLFAVPVGIAASSQVMEDEGE